jgi:hypothetical protein
LIKTHLVYFATPCFIPILRRRLIIAPRGGSKLSSSSSAPASRPSVSTLTEQQIQSLCDILLEATILNALKAAGKEPRNIRITVSGSGHCLYHYG